MEIGKKIKQLRQNKGITQETLANVLGVTYQAVSRWENGTTTPDISLLPQISIYFGVSIDELFEFTEESQYERISNMLNEKAELTNAEFESTQKFLEKQLQNNRDNLSATKLLAQLYAHYAKALNVKAADYAKLTLELGDNSKDIHNILRDFYGSPHTDWNFRNRHELIKFYYNYLEKYPENMRAYRYLLPALIADGRTEEAQALINKIKSQEKPELIFVFEAMLLRREGKISECEMLLQNMSKQFSQSWYTWSIIADFKADDCKYEEAILCYKKSFELQPSPKYTDALEAVAHICEIQEDYKEAILTYQNIIELLKNDWNLNFGATVNKYQQKIDNLNAISTIFYQ